LREKRNSILSKREEGEGDRRAFSSTALRHGDRQEIEQKWEASPETRTKVPKLMERKNRQANARKSPIT